MVLSLVLLSFLFDFFFSSYCCQIFTCSLLFLLCFLHSLYHFALLLSLKALPELHINALTSFDFPSRGAGLSCPESFLSLIKSDWESGGGWKGGQDSKKRRN